TGLETLLQRFESRRNDARMISPASDEELRRIDEALGRPLPASLRALLHEVGAGLYEGGHEIFGPSRLMAEGVLHPHFLPFHRGGATFHLIRTAGPGAGCVVSLPSGRVYADLVSFIEQVLLRDQGGPDTRPSKPSAS